MKKSMYGPLCPAWQPILAAVIFMGLSLLFVESCIPEPTATMGRDTLTDSGVVNIHNTPSPGKEQFVWMLGK